MSWRSGVFRIVMKTEPLILVFICGMKMMV